jgi:hypothetical protein
MLSRLNTGVIYSKVRTHYDKYIYVKLHTILHSI